MSDRERMGDLAAQDLYPVPVPLKGPPPIPPEAFQSVAPSDAAMAYLRSLTPDVRITDMPSPRGTRLRLEKGVPLFGGEASGRVDLSPLAKGGMSPRVWGGMTWRY